jgi:hypothetical protein
MTWFRKYQNDDEVLKDLHAFDLLVDPVGVRKQFDAIWVTPSDPSRGQPTRAT